MKLRINFFDLLKFDELLDGNSYLQKVLVHVNGEWVIEAEDTREIERLLKGKRIRYSIKNEQ